jgi:hypothetical protein
VKSGAANRHYENAFSIQREKRQIPGEKAASLKIIPACAAKNKHTYRPDAARALQRGGGICAGGGGSLSATVGRGKASRSCDGGVKLKA